MTSSTPSDEQSFLVGTDIGGTFTDMVVIDGIGGLRQFKVPTTPSDRSQAVLEGFKLAAADHGLTLEQFTRSVSYFAHGTTAATNAYIERKGERTVLLTTRGFADTMFIQRAMGSNAATRSRSYRGATSSKSTSGSTRPVPRSSRCKPIKCGPPRGGSARRE
jgi:N-methylhydantoinase A/oxoprolinase/acetone carboxylase beta subunit